MFSVAKVSVGCVEDHLRPAAVRAGVLEVRDGTVYIEGKFVKRRGFHTFRGADFKVKPTPGGTPSNPRIGR
jgi:hypothetical protein